MTTRPSFLARIPDPRRLLAPRRVSAAAQAIADPLFSAVPDHPTRRPQQIAVALGAEWLHAQRLSAPEMVQEAVTRAARAYRRGRPEHWAVPITFTIDRFGDAVMVTWSAATGADTDRTVLSLPLAAATAAATALPALTLRIERPGVRTAATHSLKDGQVARIGRAANADISVPMRELSKEHAEVTLTVQGATLRVLAGVASGLVEVNGAFVEPGETTPLRIGDRIRVAGAVEVTLVALEV